jgi:cold shock CspA family protein
MHEPAAKLMAEKLVRELFRLGQAYGQTHGSSFPDLLHDFTLMICFDDLEKVTLLFCDTGFRTLLEYTYQIGNGQVKSNTPHDPVGGLAVVPLPEPFTMRLVIWRKGKEHVYMTKLRIRWSDAPTYTRNGGDQCSNPHFAKKTGGRAGSDIYADSHLRRRGRVKFYSAEKQYGFILPDGPKAPEVFFHASDAPGVLHTGERVSYLPLVTPRGVQARAIARED